MNGRNIRYVENDKIRCMGKMQGRGCVWMAFVSKVGGFACFRLKTLQEKYTCGSTFKGYFASSDWVAKKLSKKMKLGEKMKIANAIQSAKENYVADILVTKAY